MATIGEKFLLLRTTSKLSQPSLAKILNTNHKNISSWERGKNTPDINTVIAYAKYFNISTDYLLGVKEKEKIPQNPDTWKVACDEVINTLVKLESADKLYPILEWLKCLALNTLDEKEYMENIMHFVAERSDYHPVTNGDEPKTFSTSAIKPPERSSMFYYEKLMSSIQSYINNFK